jgi:[ribosomal protein S5]-alanine N-acetyltransferase
MELKTKRLLLRELKSEDLEEFIEIGNEKAINYFTWYIPYPLTRKKARKAIEKIIEGASKKKRDHYELAITLKKGKKVIGMANIYSLNYKDKRAKIGYWIGKQYRRKGYAIEASKAMIDFAFGELQFNKLTGKTLAENKASNSLLKRLGFRKMGIAKQDQCVDGILKDCYIWEMLKNDYYKTQ